MGPSGAVSRHARVYAWLLCLYPREFRESRASSLISFFEDLAEEARYRGGWGRLRLWWRVLSDLVQSVLREHVDARLARRNADRRNGRRREATMRMWLRDDVRHALRSLMRAPTFTVAAAGTLALGIGATTAVFGVVDAILLKSLPYAEPDRLVQLGMLYDDVQSGAISPPDYFDIAERSETLASVAASRLQSLNWTADGEPERLDAAGVTASYFDVVRESPALGRTFRQEDDRRGADAVVVLSYGLWQRRFGGDPGILGRTMILDAEPWTVIGVMPSTYRGPEAIYHHNIELWFPLGRIDDSLDERGNAFMQAIGRLAPDRTLEAARSELTSIGAAIEEANPEVGQRRFWLADLRERTVQDAGVLLWLLFGAVGLLLVISCANVAHLFLVRATERSQEIAVRAAIGAGRLRIVRQLVTESVVLALLAGIAGSLIAWLGVVAFRSLGPADLPRLAEVSIDVRVLGFALGLSILTGVLFGLAPARAVLSPGLSRTLREVGNALTGTRSRTRFRSALVVVQTSLALILLVGAGLLMNSLVRLSRVDAGFEARNVVWLDVHLPDRYETAESRAAFFAALLPRMAQIPGVRTVGAVHGRPLDRNQAVTTVLPEGETVADGARAPRTSWTVITPGYFDALRIPLLAGRAIREDDGPGAPPAVVVSKAFADRFWPNQNAVGKRIRMGQITDDASFLTVVGVVDDVLHFGLNTTAEPMVYRSYAQVPRTWLGVVVRHEGLPATSLLEALRAEVWAMDGTIPLENFGTMESHVRASIGEPRFRVMALTAFSAIATILALVGLYATLTWLVRTRRRELGIRMALGAAAGDVRRMVVRRGMVLAIIGIVLGIIGALATGRLLATMMFGITTTDVSTYAAVAAGMLAVSMLACWLPARRAGATDPVRVLRQE